MLGCLVCLFVAKWELDFQSLPVLVDRNHKLTLNLTLNLILILNLTLMLNIPLIMTRSFNTGGGGVVGIVGCFTDL